MKKESKTFLVKTLFKMQKYYFYCYYTHPFLSASAPFQMPCLPPTVPHVDPFIFQTCFTFTSSRQASSAPEGPLTSSELLLALACVSTINLKFSLL